MSDHERGAYTPPTEAPLAFDPRQPVRGARPAPFSLIVSILVLAGLAGAIFLFYRAGVRQAGEAPQVVGAAIDSLKAPAPAEAQPTDPAAGLEIYKADAGQPMETAPNFAPPPEQPQPRPQAPAPVVVVTPPPPAAAPVLRPALSATLPASAAPQAAPPPQPVTQIAPPKPAPPKPVAPKPAAPAPAVAKPSGGGAVVQIGAVATEALAEKTWSQAVAAAPGMAAGKGKSVQRIDKDGGVLYRTAVTGFASREEAQAFCAKLKAAGKSCFVR